MVETTRAATDAARLVSEPRPEEGWGKDLGRVAGTEKGAEGAGKTPSFLGSGGVLGGLFQFRRSSSTDDIVDGGGSSLEDDGAMLGLTPGTPDASSPGASERRSDSCTPGSTGSSGLSARRGLMDKVREVVAARREGTSGGGGGGGGDAVLTRDHWVPDGAVTRCHGGACGAEFTLVTRRHHCRCCGNVYCHRCCGVRMLLDAKTAMPTAQLEDSVEGRVCTACYQKALTANKLAWDSMRQHGTDGARPPIEPTDDRVCERRPEGGDEDAECSRGERTPLALSDASPDAASVPAEGRAGFLDVDALAGDSNGARAASDVFGSAGTEATPSGIDRASAETAALLTQTPSALERAALDASPAELATLLARFHRQLREQTRLAEEMRAKVEEAQREKAVLAEELSLARAQVKRMGALWEELTNARRELDEVRAAPRDRRLPNRSADHTPRGSRADEVSGRPGGGSPGGGGGPAALALLANLDTRWSARGCDRARAGSEEGSAEPLASSPWSPCIVWHDTGGGGSVEENPGSPAAGDRPTRSPGVVFQDAQDGCVTRVPHHRILSARARFDEGSGWASFVVHFQPDDVRCQGAAPGAPATASSPGGASRWVECRADSTVVANRWAQELEQRARRCRAEREGAASRPRGSTRASPSEGPPR